MASRRRGRERVPLTRERVLREALRVADESGIEAVSMRRLGQLLGVEAMSLYKHVADKEDLLDGIADLVMAEIEPPVADPDWRAGIRRSAISAHDALRRHPWAGPVIESRLRPGPARLRYLDAVIGALRAAGFSLPMVANAFMALDSHIYGFTMQELNMPFAIEEAPQVVAMLARTVFAEYPNVFAMAELAAAGDESIPVDFEFGLDLILDGLERRRVTS
jgi:AcrR family transcriptional regulator